MVGNLGVERGKQGSRETTEIYARMPRPQAGVASAKISTPA